MAIERAAQPFNVGDVGGIESDGEMDIDILPPPDPELTTFDFGEKPAANEQEDFYANLAESMDEADLNSLVTGLLDDFDNDLHSRKDWEKTYKDGLDLLGLKIEERTEPWDGACGAFHPILTEAVVRFQSEAMTETFPAAGPVKTQIVGKVTPQKEEQAARVKEDMNYWLTAKMKDYRSEHERLLWSLSLAGSAFKKIYVDPTNGMPKAMFVPAEDFVVPFGVSDLGSSPRYTHVMKKTKNEIRKLQVAGFYRDIEIGEPTQEETSLEKKRNKVAQQSPIKDDRYPLYEMHVECDLPGFEDADGIERPYCVTINKTNRKVLSIYRNWLEEDKTMGKRMHFVHYPFVPGFGFYCYGWLHLIGGSAKTATSLLRQLVDAGTLSNLPGGLKTRGLRIKSEDTPISPGEWRDVDVPGGRIQDNVMALPYKEPSATLLQLLQGIVEEGRRLANITDMKIGDMNTEAPVGTTLAVLEKSLKVITAIQSRVHAAMREEFTLLRAIIRDNTPEQYEYDVDGGGREIKKADYSDVIDVLPVSDPNSTTMAQRIVQYQSAIQLAQMAPQLYSLPDLHRDMLGVLGFKNVARLVPSEDDKKPWDPVTENQAMIKMTPIKAFLTQDHESHIQTHLAFAQDPKIMELVGQSPQASAIKGAFAAHVLEHVGYAYRQRLEQQLGTSLPPEDQPMPPDMEAKLSPLIAQAGQKLLGKDLAEAKAAKIAQEQQDPVLQLQLQEQATKQAEVDRKEAKDKMDGILKLLQILVGSKGEAAEQGLKATQVVNDAILGHRQIDADVEMARMQGRRGE
jgi:hypothetical protein